MNIRAIAPQEYPVLTEFIYHALYVAPGAEPYPRAVIKKPEIAVYTAHFGSQKGDCALVAVEDSHIVGVEDSHIVGAVWARLISGYGFVDAATPELAISVLPALRGQGVGTKLLQEFLGVATQEGFEQISLAVRKDNPAVHLYERLGFKTAFENDEDFIMVKNLKGRRHD